MGSEMCIRDRDLVLKILHALDGRIILAGHDGKAGLIVGFREVHLGGTLGRDCERGHRNVNGSGHQGGNEAVEPHGKNLWFESGALGNFVDQVDVKADILA